MLTKEDHRMIVIVIPMHHGIGVMNGIILQTYVIVGRVIRHHYLHQHMKETTDHGTIMSAEKLHRGLGTITHKNIVSPLTSNAIAKVEWEVENGIRWTEGNRRNGNTAMRKEIRASLHGMLSCLNYEK